MNGVAERIEDRGDFAVDIRAVMPDVGLRHRDILGERAGPIDPDTDRVLAQVAAPRQAVAAVAADDVALGGNDFAGKKILDVGADFDDLADELMADDHWERNGFARPIVPFINMEIGAANAGFPNPNQDIVLFDNRDWCLFEVQSDFIAAFNESFHNSIIT